jgi:hypothetical protein
MQSTVNSQEDFTTAHKIWNELWKTESGREGWTVPESDIEEALPMLKDEGVETILGYGMRCGKTYPVFCQRRL